MMDTVKERIRVKDMVAIMAKGKYQMRSGAKKSSPEQQGQLDCQKGHQPRENLTWKMMS